VTALIAAIAPIASASSSISRNNANRGGGQDSPQHIEFDPSTLKRMQAYTTEGRTISVGDRLQWREPDNDRRIASGQYATITISRQVEVRLDKGRTLSMPLSEARKVDLGYASTSHASRGSTVDRVIINVDSSRSPDLVNQRQFYVGLSRPRLDAKIYTDDIERMRRAVAREQDKRLALEQTQRPRQRMAW
jgi:hypothetical protein